MGNKYGGFHENPGGKVQSNEWYTPPEIFTKLKVDFDLDVASPKEKIPWLPTEYWFSAEDDGLKKDWFGFVWCNPPYGKDTGIWLEKFIDYGNGIALVNSRTDTRWFHDYAVKADILCFVKGRISFYKPHSINKHIQGQPSSTGTLLLGCGNKAVLAIERANLGYIARNDK